MPYSSRTTRGGEVEGPALVLVLPFAVRVGVRGRARGLARVLALVLTLRTTAGARPRRTNMAVVGRREEGAAGARERVRAVIARV